MHIYYLSHSLIPSRKANSIQVMKMCQAFSHYAKEVVLFCRREKMPNVDIYDYYGVDDSFRVESSSLPKVRFVSRLLHAISAIYQLMQEPSKGLLFGRDYYSIGVISLLKMVRRPMILEVHTPPVTDMQVFLMERVFANKHFTKLVVISQALKEEYLRLFDSLHPEQIIVAHDGADSDQIPESLTHGQDYSQKGDRLKIGYIGSLLPGKGMEIIYELAHKATDCEFHVVGGNDDDIARWQAKGLPENIVLHGFVQPEQIYEFMEQFDVMLAPYQSKVITGGARKRDIGRWMSPLKLFEYMGGGKPIIASDLPVLREVIEDGENALLADPDNMDEWVEKIHYFRDQPSERERIGRNAQADFFSTYTWDKRAELLLNSINNKKHHEHA